MKNWLAIAERQALIIENPSPGGEDQGYAY